MKRLLIVIIAIFVLISISYAEIIMWVDKDGVKHFSNAGAPQDTETETEASEEIKYNQEENDYYKGISDQKELLKKKEEMRQEYRRRQAEKRELLEQQLTKEKANRELLEQQLAKEKANAKASHRTIIKARDPGPCMGDCASEQGICMGSCMGNGACISRCAASHGRCVSRCY